LVSASETQTVDRWGNVLFLTNEAGETTRCTYKVCALETRKDALRRRMEILSGGFTS
jgi:hypothetical protein